MTVFDDSHSGGVWMWWRMEVLVAAVVAALLWHQVAPDTAVWYGVDTPHNLSSQPPLLSFPCVSRRRCASAASLTPQCDLFVQDAGYCDLYHLPVDSEGHLKLTPHTTPVTTYTRHKNVCFVGGEVYQEGDTVQRQCFAHQCTDRRFRPVWTGSPCVPPFQSHGSGCFYLHPHAKTWCAARKHCESLGGDLAFEPNFITITQFLETRTEAYVWVGLKHRRWLDGREVEESQWQEMNPNGNMDECGAIRKSTNKFSADGHFLEDKSCHDTVLKRDAFTWWHRYGWEMELPSYTYVLSSPSYPP